jgi:hypothetical protein
MSWRDRVRDFLEVSDEELDESEEVEEPEYEIPPLGLKVLAASRGESLDGLLIRLTDSGFDEIEASRIIYYGEQYDHIRLVDSNPPRNLIDFIRSWYSAWAWAVLCFLVVTTLSVFILPQNAPWIYLRYVFGAVYVLYVPGAVFIEALYPKRDELEDLERFALGVGLSLALVPLVGLVLNYTPWGIRLNPIYAGLSLLTIVLTSVGAYRKYGYHMLALEARE